MTLGPAVLTKQTASSPGILRSGLPHRTPPPPPLLPAYLSTPAAPVVTSAAGSLQAPANLAPATLGNPMAQSRWAPADCQLAPKGYSGPALSAPPQGVFPDTTPVGRLSGHQKPFLSWHLKALTAPSSFSCPRPCRPPALMLPSISLHVQKI